LTGRKTTLYIAIVIVILVYTLALAGAIVIQNFWMLAVTTGLAIFSLYVISNQIKNRRKVRYPLVPPEGKSDMYVPRTNIPRPVIEDFRKVEEKKKKFAKLRRMAQKAARPKKK